MSVIVIVEKTAARTEVFIEETQFALAVGVFKINPSVGRYINEGSVRLEGVCRGRTKECTNEN